MEMPTGDLTLFGVLPNVHKALASRRPAGRRVERDAAGSRGRRARRVRGFDFAAASLMLETIVRAPYPRSGVARKPMHWHTISEVARRLGVSPDTLRYYGHIELLPAVARAPSGARL